MITLIRPLLFALINNPAFKRTLVDILRKLAEQTTNSIDDKAVDFIERGLFGS